MLYRRIADALPPVSRLSLGSWNSFSRCDPQVLERLLARAFDSGINLLDVGYYWDKPETEEAVAGALAALRRSRQDYLIAQKLWLWDYPQESFRAQLSRSLHRLRHDHVDIVLVSRPTDEVELEPFVEEVVGLIEAGLARAWGVTNFAPELAREVVSLCVERGWPRPAMLQMQYNVMRRGVVEGDAFARLFQEEVILLCAAHMLEGGILAGHLDRDRVDPPAFSTGVRPRGRNIARDAGGIREEIRRRQPILARIAGDFGVTPARLALSFCLAHPALATGLVGVTRVEDLDDNVAALALLDRADQIRAAVDTLAVAQVVHPKRFNPHNDI